jgi:hypothetical protein
MYSFSGLWPQLKLDNIPNPKSLSRIVLEQYACRNPLLIERDYLQTLWFLNYLTGNAHHIESEIAAPPKEGAARKDIFTHLFCQNQ